MTKMGEASLVFRMGVTRDRKKGAVTITQDNYTKFIPRRYGRESYNLT